MRSLQRGERRVSSFASAAIPAPSASPTLPLVGRTRELEQLIAALDDAGAGHGRTVILAGEGGVGKTRLAKRVAEDATRRGWNVAMGRAYPVETGVPYALFGDALLPLLRALDPSRLQVMTRGGNADLAHLFPALAPVPERERAAARGDSAEFKSRLLWNFTQFLSRFAAKQPLVIVLENLQWADASSLELLHFVARQIAGERIFLLCTYNDAERDANPTLRTTEQSLVSLGVASSVLLQPLSRAETEELVRSAYSADLSAAREFASLLYGWTRGNPFFVEETLKSLVESGTLYQADGRWLGWEVDALDLPRSIREAVAARVGRLTPDARGVANLAAVVGTRSTYEVLRSVSGLSERALLAALDELRAQRVLVESADAGEVQYDFAHPMVQDTLYSELGRARARLLHATVADALEKHYAEHSTDHADELAFHFARADARAAAPKAVKYLSAAGRSALDRHANREAADYLSAALDLSDRSPGETLMGGRSLAEDLAQARQRLGEYDLAMSLWRRARADAAAAGDQRRLAAIERRMGLACYWSGRHEEALEHYAAALLAAQGSGDDRQFARVQLARGVCLNSIGRQSDAQQVVHGALTIAERLEDTALLARVHRVLLLFHAWSGPADLAREHGHRAVALAREAGERGVEWSGHWGLALLAGLTGDSRGVSHHLAEAERLADELRSPLLRVWSAEIAIEYASGIGEWDEGIAVGERAISMARSLGQRTLLPRLLVWTGLVYLGRGEMERAKRYFDEAWTLSGAGVPGGKSMDVTAAIPAHTGLASYYVAMGDYERAIQIGEVGLALADRTGYVVWVIHRLLPMVTEAALWQQDLERAERYGERLRRESTMLGHRLGLAWADACDALIAMLRKDGPRAVELLRKSADDLDAIPWVLDGARVRRKLGWWLHQQGDREGAMRELRRVHDVFARLHAERELSVTREVMREIGARPPARASGVGAGGLTGRETEIARLVAERHSNKEIGTSLGISSRTVSTHLSNIFSKLDVTSRGELTDLVRRGALPAHEE